MPAGVRWVLGIALGSVLVVGLAVGATVGTVYQTGTVSVSVQHRGASNINVAVPAGIANLALAVASWVPAEAWPVEHVPEEALDALERYLPAAQEVLDRLAAQPDFVLVEVISRDEHVIVSKQGRTLRVQVESDEASIDVSIPLSTVRQFTKRLHSIARDL